MQAILFVDIQEDFIRPSGALYLKGAEGIIPNLVKLCQWGIEEKVVRLYTMDWHLEDAEEFSDEPDFKTSFPPHCLVGTPGAGIIADIPDRTQFRSIQKNVPDVFQGNREAAVRLLWHTRDRKVDTFYVCGVATDICVHHAVRGLLDRDFMVYVVEDAIKELPGTDPEKWLTEWRERGAKVVTTEEVVSGDYK